MQPRTCLLSAFTLSAAMSLGMAALAADLPKEGTVGGTYSAYGSSKSTPIDKERWFGAADENGLSVGGGVLDHMTWHSWGLNVGTNNMGRFQGYAVGTDPSGDHVVVETVSDGTVDFSKSFGGKATLVAGTGKYAGISGGWTFVCHSPEFKAAVEGAYAQYCTVQGSYKIP